MSSTSNLKLHYLTISPIAKKILNEFKKNIFDNIYYLNKDKLIYDAELVKFDKNSWENNTLNFCEEVYSEQYIFPVIHLVNSIGSIFEFNSMTLPVIIRPKLEIIKNI